MRRVNSSPAARMTEICAVIPVYEHGQFVGRVVEAVRQNALPCFLVDDGSGPACAQKLESLARGDPEIRLLHHAVNRGKGAAVQTGLLAAAAQGFSHALQIDADGQHDLSDISRFLDEVRAEPQAVICGRPVFATDAPRARLYGRRLTRFWVWVNTLSFEIPDAMCGFRVYPLGPTVDVLRRARLGARMDFDIEILVRLHWLGLPMRWISTRISYPEHGLSHFRMKQDNALIARAHTVLFFGMLARAPRLLARKLTRARNRRLTAYRNA
jgi:glycosyltransferase involved in cell wall biosynthesis